MKYAIVEVHSCWYCPKGERSVLQQGVAGVICKAAMKLVRGEGSPMPDWCPLPSSDPVQAARDEAVAEMVMGPV